MVPGAVEAALAAAGVHREGEARVLVACSGGPDSVALLRATLTLLGPRRVVAGHVDHGVRPGSAEDAAHVARLCASAGIACRVARLRPARSDEATLRELRHEALEALRLELGAALVLMGHTRDDQAETVLLRLLRGGGLRSLAGMPARRGALLRPLLGISRARVHAYARQKRWPAREDPTNLEPAYLRNRVRKELLPLLERRYARGIAGRLAGLADELAGRSPPSVGRAPAPPPARPSVPPDFCPRVAGFEGIERGITLEREVWASEDITGGPPWRALFDAGAVDGVRVRSFQRGDRVAPFGLGGHHRKVSDVLGEARVPVELRGRWPLLVDRADRVLWVAGLVRSSHALVGPSTREVWRVSIDPPLAPAGRAN